MIESAILLVFCKCEEVPRAPPQAESEEDDGPVNNGPEARVHT